MLTLAASQAHRIPPADAAAWPDGTRPDVGPCRERMLGAASAAHFTATRELVCVTLYNEPLAALQATLRSLVLAAQRQPGGTRGLVLCVIADGADRLDPAVLDFLVRQGYVGALPQGDGAATSIDHSLHAPEAWAAQAEGGAPGAPDEALRFIVAMKPHNLGKLHSHALFFGVLCPRLEPLLCCQIDAGTTLQRDALGAIAEHLKRAPEVGAVGARIGIAAPGPGDALLQRWQHMDFAVQTAAHWPAERMSGHLSVVPGQFCAFRWDALCHRPHAGPGSPVSRYLRGMAPASAMERVMFLAEDRVIGNEIVLAAGRPRRLDYCDDALATTDACTSLPELLRQRRRWNNCSFACRLWLLAQWPGVLTRGDRSLRDKLRFGSAMLWQLLLSLQQAATPASVLCTSTAVWLAVAQAWRGGHAALALAAVAASLASLPLMVWTPAAQGPRFARAWAAARDAVATGAVGLLAITVAQVLPAALALLLFAPAVAMALLPALGRGRRAALRHAAEFVSINGLLQMLLWGYALARLHDTSWGTKGLRGDAAQGPGPSMRRYCRRLLALSLALNAALIGAALALPGLGAAPSNPVAEGFGIVSALAVLMALGGRLQMAWAHCRTQAPLHPTAPIRAEPMQAHAFAADEPVPTRALDAA